MDVREKTASEKRLEEMYEYIKKDELLKFKADVYDEDGHVLYAVPTGCIVAMPPENVAPVLHGRWVEKEKYTFGIMYDCSLCENRILDNGHPWNYCPNCGAKMDGGTN